MRRLHGFSLMEMMIVLTIVAIVAAASAPMVNKKMVRAASEKSPWVFVNGESIGYNIDNENGIQDRKTATIGANGRVPNAGGNPRLYIDTNSDTTPHILFGRSSGNLMRLIGGGDNNNIWLSNANIPAGLSKSVAIGTDIQAVGSGGVSIGESASLRGNGAIAIGGQAGASLRSIAIGTSSSALNDDTVAIGSKAEVTDDGGVAIGHDSKATNDSIGIIGEARGGSSIALLGASTGGGAIAIGKNSLSTGTGSIAIGNTDSNGIYDTLASGIQSIAIGASAMSSRNAIAIGAPRTINANFRRTNANGEGAIAIGHTAQASRNAIAIGSVYNSSAAHKPSTNAFGQNSVAIGTGAVANGQNSIAIGTLSETVTAASNSIAIGTKAKALGFNQIVLGNDNTIVYIPGRLVVNRTAVLGYANGADSSAANMAIIRSNRGGKMEILQRDGDGDWDAVYASGRVDWSWASVVTSDRRLKNVGKEFTSGLDKLKKLEVFNYTFKDDKDKTPRVGVIAQDLQKIFPDAVMKGEDGFLRIRMEDMFYAVINAVKELDIRTSQQEKKINELEKRIEELEKLVK